MKAGEGFLLAPLGRTGNLQYQNFSWLLLHLCAGCNRGNTNENTYNHVQCCLILHQTGAWCLQVLFSSHSATGAWSKHLLYFAKDVKMIYSLNRIVNILHEISHIRADPSESIICIRHTYFSDEWFCLWIPNSSSDHPTIQIHASYCQQNNKPDAQPYKGIRRSCPVSWSKHKYTYPPIIENHAGTWGLVSI